MTTGLRLAGIALAASLTGPLAARGTTTPDGTTERIGTASLPGGVEGLRRALGDRTALPPGLAIAELTRRFYNATAAAADRDPARARLHAWLRECATQPACGSTGLLPDDVPLPGTAGFWREAGLDAAHRADPIAVGVLRSRGAALLYTALMSMEPPARAWLLDRPALVRTLPETERGALVVAAPYLRMRDGRWHLPGGDEAAPIWADLVGAGVDAPEAFLEAFLRARSGRLAYMLEVVATLSDAQRRTAFGLAPAADASAGRALLSALGRTVGSWRPGEQPFWRPSTDPALLLAQIPVEGDGRLRLPGGQRFWDLVTRDGDLLPREAEAVAAWADRTPVSPAWLVERMARLSPDTQGLFSQQVLFAARVLAGASAGEAASTATALRGFVRQAPLLGALERVGIRDAMRLAAVVRQAHALTTQGKDVRARARLAQWQAAVALLERIARTGARPAGEIASVVDALAQPVAATAEAPWTGWVAALARIRGTEADVGTRRIEHALIDAVTGVQVPGARVTWEGATYQVDFAAAERDRISRVRGRASRPLLDVAWALARADGAIDEGADALLGQLSDLAAAAGVDRPPEPDDEFGQAARQAASRARRLLVAARGRPTPAAAGAAVADLGEALAACALVELAYAVNMGWAEDLPLTAAAASRRHRFLRAVGPDRHDLWAPAALNTDRRFPWHVSGSLLGLDVALAPVAMRRLTLRPLTASPQLNAGDRAILVATAAALNERWFTSESQLTVTRLVRQGAAIVAAIGGASEGRRVAEAAGASTLRATVAAWLAATPRGLEEFFSVSELLRIGLNGAPLPEPVRQWGSCDAALSGRGGAAPPDLPWERYAGRSRRMLACAVPDLPIALAVHLAEMGLPASLVPSLMASATLDVVNSTPSRHADDWLALVARVQAVDRPAVERYLGLLTTGGPLRPARPRGRP